MKKVCILILALLLTGCVPKDIAVEPTVPSTEAPQITVVETTIPETESTETTQPETEPTLPPPPESEDTFVRVLDYIPTATQELRYATEDNFTGQVIAVIRQESGSLLCVAPEGTLLHQGQIAELFSEPPHIRDIDCLLRKSCGVLAYRTTENRREYLLVFEQYSQRWSLPKGHMEPGETEVQTALRELWEETGLTAQLESGKSISLEYPISPVSRKQVVLFTGAVSGIPRARDGEIQDFRWVSAEELPNYLYPGDCEACSQLINQSSNQEELQP